MSEGEGRCRDCGSPEGVIDDLCDECESNYVWCDVCRDHVYEDDPCRHVYWTDWGWIGAGSNETEWQDVRTCVFAFLDRLASLNDWQPGWMDEPRSDLFAEMIAKLEENNFWTFTSGFMFGPMTVDFMHELRPGTYLPFARLSPDVTNYWDNGEDGFEDGYGWLRSLDSDRTPKANKQTIEWIREWQAKRAMTTQPALV